MLISHKHKFISLDPPKTGTKCRQDFLSDYGDYVRDLQHANLAEVQNYFHEFDLSDYFTFTFVRNPWKRYLSWFNFLNRDNPKNNISPETFHRFMFSHLSETSRTKDLRITLPQSFWFQEQGKVNVDFIGCLENITEDMNYVLNKININIQFENRVENKSMYKLNFDNAYNQELIDLVAQKEESVIRLKNYNFNT